MAFGDFARGSHLETMPRRWGGQCCTAVWPAVTIIATTVDRGGSAAIGMRQTEALGGVRGSPAERTATPGIGLCRSCNRHDMAQYPR